MPSELSLETVAGSLGQGLTSIRDGLVFFPGGTVAMDEVRAIAVHSLKMAHSPLGPVGLGMTMAALNCAVVWPLARQTCGGDMLEVLFSLETRFGDYALLKADGPTFARLKELYLEEERPA